MDTSDYLVLKKEFIDDVYTSPSERVQPGGDDNFWTRSESPLTGGPFKSLWHSWIYNLGSEGARVGGDSPTALAPSEPRLLCQNRG